jgi:hypothetical protein
VRHLNDSLIVEAADAGVARDRLVVQYVAAVADGVDRDGPNEALFDGEARGAACRGGAAAEQTAESVFWVEKAPGVASGVARGKAADDGHYKGDKDSVVVAGFAMISCCFFLVGTPIGVLQAGLGLRVNLAPPLDMTIGRGGGIEYVEIDPVRCFVVRVGDDGVHKLVVRGGDAVEVDGDIVIWLERALSIGAKLFCDGEKGVVANISEAGCFGAAVVVKMGPVVHKHRFVSVSSVGGASAGGAADGTAGDAGITKTEVPAHGDEPLGFRVWKGQAVSHFYACI